MRVAFVHEWLTKLAGSEKVVEAAIERFPAAPIFTLVHDPDATRGTIFEKHPIHASLIDRLPFGRSRYRAYLPLMPFAIEQFDLSGYDLVLSSNHAVAKGVLTRADQLHISYVHTPARYAWDLYAQYLAGQSPANWFARWVLHRFRQWDVLAANRVDVFVANSQTVARRIWKTYRRRAHVVYPPVDVHRFSPAASRESFYLTVGRMVPYKRVDLIVRSCSALNLPLIVIGDGPEESLVRRAAGPNVTFLGHQSDAVVADHMQRCRAFIIAADEDFGIAPVEAQAAGAPVIAYGRGGVTETVVPSRTGLFFFEQSEQSLIDALRSFEANRSTFDSSRIRAHAEHFSRERFQQDFAELVDRCWTAFVRSGRGGSRV